MAGKGDSPRPMQVSRREYDLRWALAEGKITFKEFEKKLNELHRSPKTN